MITITDTCRFSAPSFLSQYLNLEEAVIFDIETTGFSPKTSSIYLIGVLIPGYKKWHLTQWLASSPEDEIAVLTAFLEFLSNTRCLVHFNGDAFDLPFLEKRCRVHGLSSIWKSMESIDLYRRFRPLKKLLKLSSMTLKSLEEFLSLSRKDTLDGGDLISVYHQFSQTKSPDLQQLLLLHNHDDLLGTASLFSLFAYTDLLEGKYELSGTPEILKNEDSFELILRLSLTAPLPKQISFAFPHGYLTAGGSSANLSIHGICGTLKYFFDDYRSYYYLPLEDTAIHKSVAAYVDKKHRIPAKASTCYCRRTSLFLPGNAASAPPKFRLDYKDSFFYQECTEEFLRDPQALYAYVREFLCM